MAEVDSKRTDGSPKWSLAGAVASAVGAAVCCVGPLLLLALGVGGAWVGTLTAMEKYRPVWTAATLVFLGLAFVRTYRMQKEKECLSGAGCPPGAARRTKFLFWIITAFVLGLLALPYLVQQVPYAFAGGPEEAPVTRQVTLSVRNMTCGACTVTVKMSLAAKVDPERLMEATTRAGYPSTVLQEGGTPR